MLSAFFKIKKCTIEIKGILSQRRTLITTVLWSGHRRALVSPGASTLTNQAERLMGRNRERQRQTKREGERNTRKYMKGKKTGLLNLQLICQSNPPPPLQHVYEYLFYYYYWPMCHKEQQGLCITQASDLCCYWRATSSRTHRQTIRETNTATCTVLILHSLYMHLDRPDIRFSSQIFFSIRFTLCLKREPWLFSSKYDGTNQGETMVPCFKPNPQLQQEILAITSQNWQYLFR